MAFARGFKTWANDLSAQVRKDLEIGDLDRLDPRELADFLGIEIINLSALRKEAPKVAHLLEIERNVFSAVTVFDGPVRTIVHNDAHAPVRQNSNLSHELSHGLLGHPPTPALDDSGCRIWDTNVEAEATWLSGCLLISVPAALAIAKGRWNYSQAARHFGVSEKMVAFRVNSSGANQRVARFH